MKYLFSLGLTISIFLTATAQGIEFRELSYQEALELAKAENKPVFMDCYTTWCGPCKWMAANMFTREDLGDYYNKNFICVKFDMENGEGLEIAKEFEVKAYPTLLFLNGEGQMLNKMVGASQEAEDYVKAGNVAMDEGGNMVYLSENLDANANNMEFMYQYMTVFGEANMLSTEEVDAFMNQMPVEELANEPNWSIIYNNIRQPESETFERLVKNEELFGEKVNAYVENVFYYDLVNAYRRAKTDEQKEAFEAKKSEIMSQKFANQERMAFRLNTYIMQANDEWDDYCSTCIDKVNKYFWDDANALNNYAWNVFEHSKNPEHLNAALAWAKRATELDRSHHILDTYANLLFVNGNAEKALAIETEAYEIAEDEGANTEAYQELIKKIKAAQKS